MADNAKDLSVTRFIDAPCDTVWQIMTERQDEWWCPRPWTSQTVALERRPGGRWATTMRGPDGEEETQDGIILAWDEGRRFIGTDAITPDFQPHGPFMIGIWEVAPEGEGTRYTATARHWTEQDRERHLEMGFEQGWTTCADQLAELAEKN